ncbi:methyltransferase domain-containing protein [Sarocladium implicatum]|nr:methyltransferase domain-containing protein [Sarocladium implicatum]
MLGPDKPLPYGDDFASPEDYVDQLLGFSSNSDMLQILCGGVHIIDFFTNEPGLFRSVLPTSWHDFLLSCDIMRLLDVLLRDDLTKPLENVEMQPPQDFIEYVASVRKFSLRRDHTPRRNEKLPTLPHPVSVGMKPKKIHEVTSFASYVQRLSEDLHENNGTSITHFVDFGSGQNYLGRALASDPYNRRVVAVEGRENNVSAAKGLDVFSGLAKRQVVMRNKKLYQQMRNKSRGSDGVVDEDALEKAIKQASEDGAFDFRPISELVAQYSAEQGKGSVQYVSGRLDSGELSEVIAQIDKVSEDVPAPSTDKSLMAVSIHSCGNLSHYGIRSLVLNPDIHAVAIVGCCYNLLTERLGPPTYKHAYLRPTLQAVNGRVMRESEKRDPQGFPMSDKYKSYNGQGVRLNITARMMACQAPANWDRAESEAFFTRHYYRTVLQRIFLDRGVVQKINHRDPENLGSESPFEISTSPVTIGSMPKSCYKNLRSYVRGVVKKLTTSTEFKEYGQVMTEKMADITDEEIEEYERIFEPRRKEICIVWTLMSFSAVVVESLIVSDRWTWLREQADVQEAWVETVFDYAQSPRNLVVVGIKR